MKMLTTNAVALLLACGLATPVLAANTTPANNESPTTANQQPDRDLPPRRACGNRSPTFGKAGFTENECWNPFWSAPSYSKGQPGDEWS